MDERDYKAMNEDVQGNSSTIGVVRDRFSLEDMKYIWAEGLAFGNMYAFGAEIETFEECMKRIGMMGE